LLTVARRLLGSSKTVMRNATAEGIVDRGQYEAVTGKIGEQMRIGLVATGDVMHISYKG
jgi:hypothetical protein